MQADGQFVALPSRFWASIRSLSQQLGYSQAGRVKTHSMEDIAAAGEATGLTGTHLTRADGRPTRLAERLKAYLDFRAHVLNERVEPWLMDAARAQRVFTRLKREPNPKCPLPDNKQTGKKGTKNYLTCIVNMLVEAHKGDWDADFDPRRLVTISKRGELLHTMARHLDGCFPSTHNPVAVWETKEYYYTTTFGSRVAGAIYETMLDGMELQALRRHGIHVRHYLMIDAHDAWWKDGASYLCRLIDILHMGYVDEVLFGAEVVERLPALVCEWADALQRGEASS